jgi:hypothetical protein
MAMDIRDMLVDGISQLNEWLDEALEPLTAEQLNWLPEGKTTSAGFNAWHVVRTQDNITNFVFKKQMPIWVSGNYFEKMALPKVDQGTGMGMEEARGVRIEDPALLRDYLKAVGDDCLGFLKDVPLSDLEEVQMIKPLGEMPKARVFRQVVMTHGFMHLGEINHIKGVMGLQFSI